MDLDHCCTLAQNFFIKANPISNINSTNIILNIVVIFILILINGFFAASEMAIVKLNDTKIRTAAADGDEDAKRLLVFLENQGDFLATVQVGVTFAGFLSAAFGANQITPVLYALIDPGQMHTYIEPLLTIGITIIISYFSLVLGELVPKQIGIRDPERYAKRFVSVLKAWEVIIRPFSKFLSASARLVCKILGIKTDKGAATVTEEEIRMMTRASGESGSIQSDEVKMIYNVFDLDDTEVSEIMTPRTAMVTLDSQASYQEVINTAAHERYSRIPVYDYTVDDIIGILHIKDLLRVTKYERNNFNLKDHVRDAYFVPEGKAISVLFREMQEENISLAIVIDEYGGTDGLITIEDILEEIVGEIADEYDEADHSVIKEDDGSYIIDGLLTLEEVIERVPEVTELEEDEDSDYDTIAGLILSKLERIPDEDEHPSIDVADLKFTVLEMDEKRISKIKLDFMPRDSEIINSKETDAEHEDSKE